ncbi:MAG: MBL fold metallo-hydrolase [Atopobiaceae bacterium]|nr:MBL fold metallo-hydrolase [Atopobiaceae bacterium]
MNQLFKVEPMAAGLYRIVDVLGNHCYLVVGETSALLVDSCGGIGNLRSCVEELTDLPVTIALTHGHDDHLSGAYWYEEAYLSSLDGGDRCWELVENHSSRIFEQVIEEGLVEEGTPFALRDGSRPRELPVSDGDFFDLGGRCVRAVAFPGHTAGSMGYLLEDLGILFSGDAVTPIMCLFFEESLSIQDWRDKTLARMAELPFDRLYTGHHDQPISKDELPTFVAASEYALTDRGMAWEHNRLHEFRGIIHLCPCDTFDADSMDFRAVIDHWHELPPRKRKGRHRHS